MPENPAMHCIKWLLFRIYNKAKYNNAILIKTKNVVTANDVTTRTDLIKSIKIKIKKASVLMSVIVDDELNSNKFKKSEAIDDIWKTWTCKTDKINKFACAIFL